jgi:AAA+ ATPase superfamily predicted ATPase
MNLPYRKWITTVLVTGGVGIIVNLTTDILPKWFANNTYLVVGSGVLICVLLALLHLPKTFRGGLTNSDVVPEGFFCGREKESADILNLLGDKTPSLFNIYGMGGVGKSSLIRQVTRENKLFKSVVWQTAKKQFMDGAQVLQRKSSESATFENLCYRIARYYGVSVEYEASRKSHEKMQLIEGLLKKHRTLLIIDNFETIDDDLNAFIKSLTDIIEGTPSKAVLTCRHRLDGVFSYKLDGLSLAETTELLNHELAMEGNKITLTKERIHQVYEATNGLPLAIKLIAAQAKTIHVAALDEILGRLSVVDFNNPTEVYEDFYRFIYEEIWKGLSKDAKKLLIKLATFSIDEQITYENLQANFLDNEDNPSNKEKAEFEQAFRQNIEFALLESKKTNNEYRFFIHPLTKTFVKADLLVRK